MLLNQIPVPFPLTKEEIEKLKARQAQEEGIVQRVWMGGESEGWKERRLKYAPESNPSTLSPH
jgi:hypothetical protein